MTMRRLLNLLWRLDLPVALCKKLYSSIDDLQKDLDQWAKSYNEERPHPRTLVFRKDPAADFP